jgi:hypothetical protein
MSPSSKSLSAVTEHVLREVTALVGCPAEGVTGARRENGGWALTVEVLEVGRVPETTDVLATYAVTTDERGDVMELRRERRYLRGRTDD